MIIRQALHLLDFFEGGVLLRDFSPELFDALSGPHKLTVHLP